MHTQWLMVVVMAVGIIATIFFHVGLHEVQTNDDLSAVLAAQKKSMEWCDWLKEYQFYLVICHVLEFLHCVCATLQGGGLLKYFSIASL